MEPSFTDISVHFPLVFARGLTGKRDFFSKFPHTVEVGDLLKEIYTILTQTYVPSVDEAYR